MTYFRGECAALEAEAGQDAVSIRLLSAEGWLQSRETFPAIWQDIVAVSGFLAKPGQLLMLPATGDQPATACFGSDPGAQSYRAGRALAARLPAGLYRIPETATDAMGRRAFAIGFGLGAYLLPKPGKRALAQDVARLVLSPDPELADVIPIVTASAWVRDLVNLPAGNLGPADLEREALAAAQRWQATIEVTCGPALLDNNYPSVHAVGRAAAPDRAPRLIEMSWGRPDDPVLCLVGKGVTFDTGGLDIKPSSGMRLMKKDMGGAAHVLGLAEMIVAARLPVRLHVLIPAVENAISGEAMRPGDVLESRSGQTIEVGNTDAEGRLILADALTRAGELSPSLTIDMATLTGAARVAMGPEVIPFFSTDQDLADQLARLAGQECDPVWQLPLWDGYESALDSDVADLKNDPSAWAQAGTITAALFLRRFAPAGSWMHFDVFAWNSHSRPGWPSGGEAQTLRALLALIRSWSVS